MKEYDLFKVLGEELQNGSSDLVTRTTGQSVRNRIEQFLAMENAGTVVALDFSRIGVIDYSCADEIVAKLISRLCSGEYGQKHLFLAGLTENQKENVEAALERKGLAVMASLRAGQKVLVGELNNYLKDTLALVMEMGQITARDLAEIKKVATNTSGTRLLNLYRKGLVKRVDQDRAGGKVWVYRDLTLP